LFTQDYPDACVHWLAATVGRTSSFLKSWRLQEKQQFTEARTIAEAKYKSTANQKLVSESDLW